jgi:hypothetical protein
MDHQRHLSFSDHPFLKLWLVFDSRKKRSALTCQQFNKYNLLINQVQVPMQRTMSGQVSKKGVAEAAAEVPSFRSRVNMLVWWPFKTNSECKTPSRIKSCTWNNYCVDFVSAKNKYLVKIPENWHRSLKNVFANDSQSKHIGETPILNFMRRVAYVELDKLHVHGCQNCY